MAASCLHGLFFGAVELTANWLKSKSRNNGAHELVEILEKIKHEQVFKKDT